MKGGWNFLRGLLGNPAAVIDYVREARAQLREQVPAGRQALAEKKQALTDVKARLARYHERFERAANAGEEDLAWERIKELREQETALKAEIAGLEAPQVPHSDRELDAVRARRYLRTLARFFRSRPRYEESLYEALHQHHGFRVAVLARDLIEATLEFEGEIEPSDEDDSMSRDRPMYTGGGQTVYIGRRAGCCAGIPLDFLRSAAHRSVRENHDKHLLQTGLSCRRAGKHDCPPRRVDRPARRLAPQLSLTNVHRTARHGVILTCAGVSLRGHVVIRPSAVRGNLPIR